MVDLSTYGNPFEVTITSGGSPSKSPAQVEHQQATNTHSTQIESVIIGPFDQGVRTRHQIAKEISHVYYVSNEAPKNVKEGLNFEELLAMQEELNQFV